MTSICFRRGLSHILDMRKDVYDVFLWSVERNGHQCLGKNPRRRSENRKDTQRAFTKEFPNEAVRLVAERGISVYKAKRPLNNRALSLVIRLTNILGAKASRENTDDSSLVVGTKGEYWLPREEFISGIGKTAYGLSPPCGFAR